MSAQIIDDTAGNTLVSASTTEKEIKKELEKTNNVDAAAYIGQVIAKRAIDKGIVAEIKENGLNKVRVYSIDCDEYCEFGLEEEDKPAFVVPVYPVVTMTHECVHKRSRRGLLGDNKKNNQALRDLLSLEKNVPANCPPVFLINCKDDPIVDYRNSELLDAALTAKNIPHTYIQYTTGGHGFGASETKGTEECREWKNEFLKWFVTNIK